MGRAPPFLRLYTASQYAGDTTASPLSKAARPTRQRGAAVPGRAARARHVLLSLGPFVMETHGRMGADAVGLLLRLARAADDTQQQAAMCHAALDATTPTLSFE